MKKRIVCLLLFIFMLSSYTYALTTLAQKETTTKLASGVDTTEYQLFTEDGWVTIHVLTADLENDYTQIDLLTSQKGAGKLENILSMAQNADAVAAINADFFAGNNGNGHSIGLSMRDSTVISSAALENASKSTFATFLLDEHNQAFCEYVTNQITITSKKTKKSTTIQSVNKYATNYDIPALFTSDWGEFSIGSSDSLHLTELVVKNNKVLEIRQDQPSVAIPENGFVLSAAGEGATFIKENFKKGTRVTLDIAFTPDIPAIQLAISGGAKLLENGEIPSSFSHVIAGRNPRTALGINQEGNTLYLITVDGRSKNSIGMTQTELAEFLKTLSIDTAINLDGGGSTTLIEKLPGEENLTVVNQPSDGGLRSVINGIGIFSKAPKSKKITTLTINVEDTNVFIDEERTIQVIGYNKYDEPVLIDFEDIDWETEGVPLSIQNGVLCGDTVGTCLLTASVGRAKAQIEINILSQANELFLSPKKTAILPGQDVSYTVQAKNKNGYYATTKLDTITTKIESFWKENQKQIEIPQDAQLNNFHFTATTPGEYLLSFQKGDILSYALVSVQSPKQILIDDFENLSFSFDEYPDEAKGNATLSQEHVYSGNSSVQLDYDFRQEIAVRGAYIELKNPVEIPKEAQTISFWVYNESPKQEKLKIKLKDANGATKLIVLQDSITHKGWQEITYNVTSLSLPAKLSDIYLAQDDIHVQATGTIYVDYLTYSTKNSLQDVSFAIPKDQKIENHLSKKTETDETGKNVYHLAVLDQLQEPKLMIDQLKNKTLLSSISKNADNTIFLQNCATTQLPKTKVSILKQYSVWEQDSIFTGISLNASTKSIRKTDASQWLAFVKDIQNAKTKNVLLFLNESIDNFTDLEERHLFVDTLCELQRSTKKQIYVIHKGFYNDISKERGVTFLGVNNQNTNIESISKDTAYLLLTITDESVHYEYKNVFSNEET